MGWFDNLFGGDDEERNPSAAAMPYLNQIPGLYDPLKQQFSNLSANPGQRLNEIGGEYKQSPGFQHALQQALMASQHDAAAGGMLGTPASQYNAMEAASGLASQDYNNWMNGAVGLHNLGLAGQSNIADNISQVLAQQGAYGYMGQANQNQNNNTLWSNLFRGLGGAAGGFMTGGPMGAAAGGFGGLSGGMWG